MTFCERPRDYLKAFWDLILTIQGINSALSNTIIMYEFEIHVIL